MILAGIDEAGYGPLLGPLVVGCCAFEVDGVPTDGALPCLWDRLRKIVSKSRPRNGKKLHINDSKLVYSPGGGLGELEKSILAMAATLGTWRDSLQTFIGDVAGHVLVDLAEYPWYQPPVEERFPLEHEAASVRVMANALRAEMQRGGAKCVHLSARVLPERQLNTLFDKTRNKANALFSVAAIHLDYLLRAHGQQELTIFCDRQGGREHYGHVLRLMFEDWSMEILLETPARSEYCLHRDGHRVKIIFSEKAESLCLPVAMASMLCKYLRETLMRRFNAYWQTLQPGLAPTAGYYTDGNRFLADIAVKRRELGIRDEQLIRSR